MIPTRRWLPIALLVLLAGGFLLVTLQQRLDRTLADYRTGEQLLYLSSPEWVKRLSLGYGGLLGSLYWTRAVQHYGRQRLGPTQYKLLYPLLDITTTLDPELIIGYRFGSIFLSEEPPLGPGRPDLAIQLLRKGIRQQPDEWRLWYDLGFVYYRSLEDYQKAADAFYEGSKHPDSAPWMRVMAAHVATEGGSRRLARFLWAQLYKSTENEYIRKNAIEHLQGLQADEDIEFLQALLGGYRRQTGQPAESFQQLVAAGLLRKLPLDPLGFPYRLGPDGRVQLDPESPIRFSALGREK